MDEEKKEEGKVCTGDCLACSPAQRQYCAAQNAYTAARAMQGITGEIEALRGTVEQLTAKLRAIESSEALVFAPTETAQ